MNTLKLKPQFNISIHENRLYLFDENKTTEEPIELAELFKKLEVGIDVDSVSDSDFEKIQTLTERGYISLSDSDSAAIWELCGVPITTVEQQLAHFKVSIIDRTCNNVGQSVKDDLMTAGVKVVESDATLCLLFVDSYFQIQETDPKPYLPIVCNRLKLWLGPVQHEWTSSIVESVKKNHLYADEIKYKLPLTFDLLQRSWLSSAILSMIVRSELRTTSALYMYNMKNFSIGVFPV